LSSAPHSLGNENTLIFRHGATNLQQQLIMRILTHRPVQKFHRATGAFQFLDEHHLVNVVSRESIRSGLVIITRFTTVRRTRSRSWSNPGRFRLAPL
jgi:hypothetical protein